MTESIPNVENFVGFAPPYSDKELCQITGCPVFADCGVTMPCCGRKFAILF